MLPFKLVEVDEPILHLQSGDVNVETEFFISELAGTRSHQEESDIQGLHQTIHLQVREAAYRAFATFLSDIAEPTSFLPVDQLSQYPQHRYSLIISVPRWYELHEIMQNDPDSHWLEHGNMVFEYDGYEIELKAKHFVRDTSVFLVSPEKYTLFFRSVQDTETIRYYRSQFTDLSEHTPSAYQLNAQDFIETIQQNIVNCESALPIGQLLMFPPSNETESDANDSLTFCPVCTGEVRRINKNFFCLECDWDDLPILKRFSKDK